jgi:hypothetical protein
MWFNKNKDTLARLLAAENVRIRHSRANGATFDPKTRILTLPSVDHTADENTYDLIIGTGVARALYGPDNESYITSLSTFADKAKYS